MQIEVGEKFIVIICDGSHRNSKFYNRIRNAVAKVETPDKFKDDVDRGELKQIQRLVDKDITDKAYVLYSTYYTSGGYRRELGSWIYFYDEAEAMAFKLKWCE